MFVIYFAMGSISAGAASLLNARLVMRHGMRRLSFIAITTLTLISALLWGWTEFVGHPGFILFMVWQTSFIFCIGMIFGNVQSLAMEPLGHVAGLAAAIFGAVSTLVSLPLSWLVSGYFDNSIAPLVAGFTIAGAMSLAQKHGVQDLHRVRRMHQRREPGLVQGRQKKRAGDAGAFRHIVILEPRAVVELAPALREDDDQPGRLFQMRLVVGCADLLQRLQPFAAGTAVIEAPLLFLGGIANPAYHRRI